MLITSVYNKDTLTEKAWYQSSNIFYSEFIENPVKNEGDLYVTFNNGATYKYKNVQITPDYVMFKHGGLEGSHGKALNSHIKPKYVFEKVDNRDINKLISEKELCLFEKEQEKYNKTYFISGHRDITHSDFIKYRTTLAELIEDLAHVIGHKIHVYPVVLSGYPDADAPFACQIHVALGYVAQEAHHIVVPPLRFECLAGVELGNIKQLVDEGEQVLACIHDIPYIVLRVGFLAVFGDILSGSLNDGERCAKFVCDVGKKPFACFLQFFQLCLVADAHLQEQIEKDDKA